MARSLHKWDNVSLWNLEKYHQIPDIIHEMVASSSYRYFLPPSDISLILQKEEVLHSIRFLSSSSSLVAWQDPGLGWLGYRIIRPSSDDGYPPSCKNWGAAAGVYSIWLPVLGCNAKSNIRFLPGSHKASYERYLPENSKFTKGEYRLKSEISPAEFIRPEVNQGDIIIYHPNTIHSEDSEDSHHTRINLEYRYMPVT